ATFVARSRVTTPWTAEMAPTAPTATFCVVVDVSKGLVGCAMSFPLVRGFHSLIDGDKRTAGEFAPAGLMVPVVHMEDPFALTIRRVQTDTPGVESRNLHGVAVEFLRRHFVRPDVGGFPGQVLG